MKLNDSLKFQVTRNSFFLCLLILVSFYSSGQKKAPPNILFIPVDDLRPELGCYGNTIIKTPNIDAIAKNGMVFNRAYCQQAVCNPSRVSLLTGLRPDATKIWDLYTNFRTILPDAVTLPQYFKEQGYQTIGLGKTFHNIFLDSLSWNQDIHLDGFPFDPDAIYVSEEELQLIESKKQKFITAGNTNRIDKYGQWYIKSSATEKAAVEDDAYYDGAQTTRAIKEIKEFNKTGKPFFLSVGFYRPHLPFNAPKKYWDLYDRNTLPIAPNQFTPLNAPAFAIHGDLELRGYDDMRDLPLPSVGTLDTIRQRKLLHGYYASVSYIDAQIGRLIKTLKEEGLFENTIIVLWGDHGWKLGEHNSWAKQTNFEIDTRVPFIISGKNVKAKGTVSNALVELLDIYPTLTQMTGFTTPSNLQGNSLVPLLSKPNIVWKETAASQFLLGRFPKKDAGNDEKMGYSIRTDHYRYTEWYRWVNDSRKELIAIELYDHRVEDTENENIAGIDVNKILLNELSVKLHQQFKIKD